MASSVEARLPFLDHRLVQFLFALPADMKIRDGWTKYIMRRALEGRIPELIRTRADKVAFSTPEDAWFREGRSFILGVLDAPSARNRGLYRRRELLSLLNAHFSGNINAGRAIWRALNLELWFRRFVD